VLDLDYSLSYIDNAAGSLVSEATA
jgi:hypothetical protein